MDRVQKLRFIAPGWPVFCFFYAAMPLKSPQQILENLSNAVLCLDSGLRVSYLNPACEVLFGVSSRYAENQPLAFALPSLAQHQQQLEEALRNRHAYTARELSLPKGHGTVTVDCSVTPLMGPEGERGLLLELAPLDRHLRISRDDQLLAQHEASRVVVRGLAHEIKNPLGGLRGAAQLLERELDNDTLKEYTQVIIGEADRLQNLVNRLLGPNRPLEMQPINVHEPLERVRQLVEAELSEGISLERDYDPSIPDLEADPEQLIQVFLNIVGNAVQAIGDRGKITLRTRTQRRFTIGPNHYRLVVRIDIADNGPGIDPEMVEQIFYPMVTSRAEGSGLGLSIAQSLINAHGGLIECQSRPGDTVFSIFLPLEKADA